MLSGVNSQAAGGKSLDPKYFQVGEVKIQEVVPTAQELYLSQLDFNNLIESAAFEPNTIGIVEAGVYLDQLILIGQKIVQIIKAGQSVVNIKRDVVSVVPTGISDWSQLGGWQVPVTKVLQVQVENLYGWTMIDLRLKVSAMYGGSYNGAGKYLANVIMVPSTVVTQWGYNLDLWTENRTPVNMGTSANPIAGLGFDVRYKIKTLISELNGSQDYFITGEGKIHELK